MSIDRLSAWERIPITALTEVEDPREQSVEYRIFNDDLWPPALSNPQGSQAVELIGVGLVQCGVGLLCGLVRILK